MTTIEVRRILATHRYQCSILLQQGQIIRVRCRCGWQRDTKPTGCEWNAARNTWVFAHLMHEHHVAEQLQ